MSTNSGLSKSQVRKIRNDYRRGGVTFRQLADANNCSVSFVHRLVWNEHAKYRDPKYTPPVKKRLNLQLCHELRQQGFSYARISFEEAVQENRDRPYSAEQVRRKLTTQARGRWL